MKYKNVEITKNSKSGNYYLKSPANGTTRIFESLERAKYYIDNYEVLEDMAKALMRERR